MRKLKYPVAIIHISELVVLICLRDRGGCATFIHLYEAHIYAHTDIDLKETIDKMSYEPMTLHDCAAVLPLKVFECHPPQSKKIISLVFEPVSEEVLNLVITGGTWVFRDELEAYIA
jgi:hypothetical protein